jgi:hypothetical protein
MMFNTSSFEPEQAPINHYNEGLHQNYLPLHQASGSIQKMSPDELTPPSSNYSPSLSLGTGISAHSNISIVKIIWFILTNESTLAL